tara:strand:+ start:9153 stop:11240 length:2088 start_codon:yes stop_codon:yes gene_type:complete
MNLYDTDSALKSKRIKSNFGKGQLVPSQMSSSFGAEFNHLIETEHFNSNYWGLLDSYDKANKEIEDQFGLTLPNPLIDDMREEFGGKSKLDNFLYRLVESTKRGAGQTNISSYKEQVEWWNKEVEKIRNANPNAEFKDLNYFIDERAKKAQTNEFLISEMKRADRTFMEKYGKTTGAAALSYMTDAFFLQTLPLSFAYSVPRSLGGAMIKTAIMEGALEMGRMGIIQTAVQPYRKQLGLSYGFDQGLMNTLMAGLGGAVFAPATLGLFRAAAKGVKGVKPVYLSIDEMISKKYFPKRFIGKKLNQLLDQNPTWKKQPLHIVLSKINDKDLLDIFEDLPDVVKNNPDYQAASYNLKQAIIEANQNPYKNTAAGQRQHSANTKKAHEQAAVDEKIDVTDGPDVEVKQPDLEQEIINKQAEIAAREESLVLMQEDNVPIGLKKENLQPVKVLQKEINKNKKELKKLQKQLADSKKLPSSLETPKEPKVERFLNWLRKNKIKSDDYNIGDVRAILDKSILGFIKKGGYSLDDLVTKAREDGWLPPKPEGVDDVSINDVLDLISENPSHPRHAQELAEFDMNVNARDQQIDMLESAGYDPFSMSDVDVEIALQKIANKVDDQEIKLYKDENYLDEAYDNNFDEVMDFFDSKAIDENADVVLAMDDEGNVAQSVKAKDIKEEIQADKKALNELSKCKGLDV